MIVCCLLSHFGHVRLFETLWTVIRQAPLSMGFSRQEYWSGLPCPPSGALPNPGIAPRSPALQVDSLASKSLQTSEIFERKRYLPFQDSSMISLGVLLLPEYLDVNITFFKNTFKKQESERNKGTCPMCFNTTNNGLQRK